MVALTFSKLQKREVDGWWEEGGGWCGEAGGGEDVMVERGLGDSSDPPVAVGEGATRAFCELSPAVLPWVHRFRLLTHESGDNHVKDERGWGGAGSTAGGIGASRAVVVAGRRVAGSPSLGRPAPLPTQRSRLHFNFPTNSACAKSLEKIETNLSNKSRFLSETRILAKTPSRSRLAWSAGVAPTAPSIPCAVSLAINSFSTRQFANHCRFPPTVATAVMEVRLRRSAVISRGSPPSAIVEWCVSAHPVYTSPEPRGGTTR